MRAKNRKNFLHQFLIFFAIWSSFAKMVVDNRIHDILAVVSVLLGIILILYAVCELKVPRIIGFIWGLFCVAGLLNILLTGNLYISVFASIMLSYFPISLSIVFAKRLNVIFWKWNYIVAGLYLTFRMITSVDGVLLFHNLSRNNLSVLLLAWLIIYAIVLQKNNCEIPLWSILFYYCSCIIAVGRSGIFVAQVILTLYWLYYFFYKSYHNSGFQIRFFIGIISLIIFSVILYYNIGLIFNKLFSRFAEIGLAGSEDRLGMIKDYFNAWKSLQEVIFGINKNKIYSISVRDGNPHNSYVFVHMYFGMTGFLFLIFWGFKIIRYFFIKKQYGMMILSVGYFFRIFTDSVFPGSFGGDIAFWIFVFCVIQQLRIKNQKYNLN